MSSVEPILLDVPDSDSRIGQLPQQHLPLALQLRHADEVLQHLGLLVQILQHESNLIKLLVEITEVKEDK